MGERRHQQSNRSAFFYMSCGMGCPADFANMFDLTFTSSTNFEVIWTVASPGSGKNVVSFVSGPKHELNHQYNMYEQHSTDDVTNTWDLTYAFQRARTGETSIAVTGESSSGTQTRNGTANLWDMNNHSWPSLSYVDHEYCMISIVSPHSNGENVSIKTKASGRTNRFTW